MKQIIKLILLTTGIGFAVVACGGNTTNINTNRVANAAANMANTVANTAANAVNTAANAVSRATTASADDFLEEAAGGGLAEVEMGKLAASKAQNAEVKKFGQMMVADHTKANAELKALAAKKNIKVPADASSHRSTIEELKQLIGADFDKAYVKAMVDDHETDVDAFQKQADNATDPDVKAFATKTLPTLKKHLEAIKAIQAKMK